MDIPILGVLFTVVLAHFLALLSPGPDFILIVKSSLQNGRQQAMGVALGIAVANGVYISLCLIGVGAAIASSTTLMTGIRVFGGIFLTYLAWMALRAQKKDYAFLLDETRTQHSPHSRFLWEFGKGFASAILNPKNPVFYISLFSWVLNDQIGLGWKIGLGVWMTTLVFVWDSLIVYALSQRQVRAVFARGAYYLDKVTGLILGVLGVKLISTVAEN